MADPEESSLYRHQIIEANFNKTVSLYNIIPDYYTVIVKSEGYHFYCENLFV